MTGEGARNDFSYCHCEAHGAEAISSLFTSGLPRFARNGRGGLAMAGEGARTDSSYCHCEAHGAEAILSLFTSGLLRFAPNGIKELAIWKLVNLSLIKLSSLGVCRVLGWASRELKQKEII